MKYLLTLSLLFISTSHRHSLNKGHLKAQVLEIMILESNCNINNYSFVYTPGKILIFFFFGLPYSGHGCCVFKRPLLVYWPLKLNILHITTVTVTYHAVQLETDLFVSVPSVMNLRFDVPPVTWAASCVKGAPVTNRPQTMWMTISQSHLFGLSNMICKFGLLSSPNMSSFSLLALSVFTCCSYFNLC